MGTRLTGKRALITGAASGIGLATARRFALEGSAVGLVDINEEAVAAAVERIEAAGGRAYGLTADVSSEGEISAAIDSAEQAFGGLDVVVANAATQVAGSHAPIDELDADVWRRMIDVNLTGTFLTCKHAIRSLKRSGGGSLICTGSPTGMIAMAPGAYSSAKAGVMGLVRILARESAADGIRVNSVVPGLTDTPFVADLMANETLFDAVIADVPLGRPGTAEEVASMMTFLASDESSYATGALFIVDGGRTAV